MCKNNHKYLVIGYGLTGKSVVNYLLYKKLCCVVYDDSDCFEAHSVRRHPMIEHTNSMDTLDSLSDYEGIFVSPGIPETHPLLQLLKQSKVEVLSDIAIFLPQIKGTIIGITGSNGKSTVTKWLEHVLIENNKKALAVGNIGLPVLDYLSDDKLKSKKIDYWVIELSSFQIQLIAHPKTDMATIINISEDHIDRHFSFGNYVKIKQKLLRFTDYSIVNRDNPESYFIHDTVTKNSTTQQPPSYGTQKPIRENDYGLDDGYLVRGKEKLFPMEKLKLFGIHNALNALIVWMFARQCDLSDEQIGRTIGTWHGLAHRFEKVLEQDGAIWINDSKSTNVGAVEAAIESCVKLNARTPAKFSQSSKDKNILLIIGGQSKNNNFAPLVSPIEEHVRQVFLFGEDASKIAQSWQKHSLPLKQFTNLEEIIVDCYKMVREGDFVLFSPGCASFDSYENYAHRGDHFKQLVKPTQYD